MSTPASISLAPRGPVDLLRTTSTPDWDAAVTHRFVNELFAGSLDDDVLRHYLVQDYQFFDAFISMLGACVAHADTIAPKLRFAQQLGFLASDEDTYFVRAFAELGVSEADYLAPRLNPAAAAFEELMYDAVASASYPDLLAALVVAEWLYLDWGERDEQLPERAVHRGWIDLHRGEVFRGWVQFLISELERVYPSEADVRARVERRWRDAVRLEREFFDAAYAAGPA